MHRSVDLEALGLDADRAELVRQVLALHGQVHDQALMVAGPIPQSRELTTQQLRVLGFVVKEPGLSGHTLGQRLGVSAPTASGLVDRLVDKGLVRRVDDPDDRRVRRLYVTEDGQLLMREADSLLGRAMMKVIQVMSLEELEVMRRSAEVMLAAMARAKTS